MQFKRGQQQKQRLSTNKRASSAMSMSAKSPDVEIVFQVIIIEHPLLQPCQRLNNRWQLCVAEILKPIDNTCFEGKLLHPRRLETARRLHMCAHVCHAMPERDVYESQLSMPVLLYMCFSSGACSV